MWLVKNKETLYIYSLYLLVFLIPSGVYKLGSIAIVIALVTWLYSKQYKNLLNKITVYNILLPILFVLYLLSLFYTENLKNGVKQITMHLSYLLIPLFFITDVITKKVRRTILLVFVFSTILFVLLTYFYAIIDIIRTNEHIVRINLTDYKKYNSYGLTRIYSSYHPTYASLFLNLSFIIVLKYFSDKNKIAFYGTLFFIAVSIFLLNSMIGIICFGIVGFTYLFLKVVKKQHKALIVIFFLTTGAINFVFNPLQIKKQINLKTQNLK